MNAIITMSRLSEVHSDELVEQTINTRRRWVSMASSERGAPGASGQATPSGADVMAHTRHSRCHRDSRFFPTLTKRANQV
jgi:hypothetical protein